MSNNEKLRMTRQRQMILDELMKVRTHPTAYEVHEMVKRVLPQISLGTVYRNLEQLSACGRILKLSFGNGNRRYDGNAAAHPHFSCLECGRVEDLPAEQGIEQAVNAVLEGSLRDHQVLSVSMKVYGLCPDCRKQGNSQSRK